MKSNKVICFICGKIIKAKHISMAIHFIDIQGKTRTRHAQKTKGCQINCKLNPVKRK